MTRKHHQEEISGPLDSIEAAQLLEDLPKPKRARIQSRKARENRAQTQQFEVFSLRPAIVPTLANKRAETGTLRSLLSKRKSYIYNRTTTAVKQSKQFKTSQQKDTEYKEESRIGNRA
jgi:hypothetical protein